jgi:hypothetical protein
MRGHLRIGLFVAMSLDHFRGQASQKRVLDGEGAGYCFIYNRYITESELATNVTVRGGMGAGIIYVIA